MDFPPGLKFAGQFLAAVLLLVLLGGAANVCLTGWLDLGRRWARTLRWRSGG